MILAVWGGESKVTSDTSDALKRGQHRVAQPTPVLASFSDFPPLFFPAWQFFSFSFSFPGNAAACYGIQPAGR